MQKIKVFLVSAIVAIVGISDVDAAPGGALVQIRNNSCWLSDVSEMSRLPRVVFMDADDNEYPGYFMSGNTVTLPPVAAFVDTTGYYYNYALYGEPVAYMVIPKNPDLGIPSGIGYPGQDYVVQFPDSSTDCSNAGGVQLMLRPLGESQLPDSTIVSKKYVDAEMAKLQPQFAGLGDNKLMTYSSTTNGAVGSRDIVTELGTSTTANSIPTRGAIVTGINTKQDTVNGTAGWVMENTGTAGSVKAKPVYSTTDNYKTALVEAGDLNQIVVDAVNSELIPVEGVGWRINTAANLTLPTLRMMMPDVSINGSNRCMRYLSGTYDKDNTCSAATLSTLGASGNKSGLWGAVMPYGDIVGKSVCSATQGSNNTAATDAQESTLTTGFNNQTGVGVSSGQLNCWCKMESVDGEPAVSRWVLIESYAPASACAANCASVCGSNVQNSSAFRSALFNSVQ